MTEQERTPQKSNRNGMPREIWAELGPTGTGFDGVCSLQDEGDGWNKYLLFSAHEEITDGLHSQIDFQAQRAEVAESEVERLETIIAKKKSVNLILIEESCKLAEMVGTLLAREAKWRELVETMETHEYRPGRFVENRIHELRSELME